jgi:hypothetical protein
MEFIEGGDLQGRIKMEKQLDPAGVGNACKEARQSAPTCP